MPSGAFATISSAPTGSDGLLSGSSRKYYQAFERPELPRIRDGLRAGNDAASEKFSIHSVEDLDVSKAVEEMLRASSQRSFKLGGALLSTCSPCSR
jgi:hypothetical protein